MMRRALGKRQPSQSRFETRTQVRYSGRAGERPTPNLDRHSERTRILGRHVAEAAGLPSPELIDPRLLALDNPDLPIANKKREFQKAVRENQIVLLGGETGSGKTTQSWKYLLEIGYEKVFVFLPRRIIVDNLASRALEEVSGMRDEEFAAELVGMAHSERSTMQTDNKVVFMTPGTYMRMADRVAEEWGDKPIALISDEIHEANFPTEVATAVGAMQLAEHPAWRLIVSSATHDRESVINALGKVNGKKIPHVTVEGRPHNVEMRTAPTLNVAELYAQIGAEHESALIFTSGKQEIDDIIDAIRLQLGKDADSVEFRKLHSKLTTAAMMHLQKPVPEGKRVVVVATPAGQSGITLPGTTLVISDGEIKRNELNEQNVQGLAKRLLSRAGIIQQAGRAGRDVGGGVFYLASPLAGEYVAQGDTKRPDHEPAEIYSTNLSRTALTITGLGRDFYALNDVMIHSTEARSILDAYESLYRLGATNEDDSLTELGKDMDMFTVRPELSRGIVEAWKGKHSAATLVRTAIVAAAIESGGLPYFAHDTDDRWKKLLRSETDDDIIAQLDIYHWMTESGYSERYLDERNLFSNDVDPKNAYITFRQTRKILGAIGLRISDFDVPVPTSEEEQEVRNCVAAGMIDMVHSQQGKLQRGRSYHAAYGNILENGEAILRTLSTRSLLDEDRELVAAWPRWYEGFVTVRDPDGNRKRMPQQVDILEMGMPVSVDMIRPFTRHLTGKKMSGTRLRQGKVVETSTATYGTLELGTTEARLTEELSDDAKEMLKAHVLEHQGRAQRELRALKSQIWGLHNRVLPQYVDYYFERTPITEKDIEVMIDAAVESSMSEGEVDHYIRQRMYEKAMHIDSWIDVVARKNLLESTPDTLEWNGFILDITYRAGVPTIKKITVEFVKKLLEHGDTLKMPSGQKVHIVLNKKTRTLWQLGQDAHKGKL